MILGGPEVASALHRLALAVMKWIGLAVENQGVSPTYALRVLRACSDQVIGKPLRSFRFSLVATAGQNSASNAGID